MREILFKAKTISGNWVNGLLANKDDKWYISNKAGSPFAYEVRPETLCQFTGRCDKNENKIWENDIIQYGAVAAVVKFGEYGNGNLGFYVDFPEETNYRKDFSYWAKKVVVIGNAVDDRSLLQEVK